MPETTCDVFFTDLNWNVLSSIHSTAECDSVYTDCTIKYKGYSFDATCDSQLHDVGWIDKDAYSYFCSCGGKKIAVPPDANCDSRCYDLTTLYSKCSFVTLYNGFAEGNSNTGLLEDYCYTFNCDSTGTNCTDTAGDDTSVYFCDNKEQDYPTSDTQSYVCNCHGAAIIPDEYRTKGVETQGTKCGYSSQATSSADGNTADNTSPSKATNTKDSGALKGSGSAFTRALLFSCFAALLIQL